MPTRRRSSTASRWPAWTLWPSSRISPSVRAPGMSSFMRFSVRRKVDFPQPDGPMSAVTWCSGRRSAMSFTASFSP